MVPKTFKALSMSWKIAALAVSAAFIGAVGVGAIALSIADEAARSAIVERQSSVVEARASKLSGALQARSETLRVVAGGGAAANALKQFGNAVNSEARDLWVELRKAYVDDNPHPANARYELVEAPDASMFSVYHRMHHGAFVELMKIGRYDDVLLIDATGRVVYSAAKRADFGADLTDPSVSETGLASAWRAVKDATERGSWSFADLAAYAPADAPQAFMAAPIFDARGEQLGAIAVALPERALTLNLILGSDAPDALAVYLLGADGTFRTTVLGGDYAALDAATNGATIAEALASGEATGREAGAFSDDASIAARLVRFGGVDWVLVAEEPAARALADIASLRWAILSAAGVVVLVAAVAAALLARGLSTPIRRMSDAVGKLASGELVEIPGQGRGDEIGALASSLGQIHHRAVEAQRIRTALDCSASATLVVAPDFRVVYANAAMTGVVERTPDFWRRVSPGVLADGLIGCNLTETLDVVRVLLDSLASGQAAAEAEAEFGDRVFTLTGAPVNDEHGERIGYAIQWREITDRRRMEREIARVISGVAEGDLTARIETVSEDPFLRDLADGVNRICGLIDDFTAELDRSVGALADGDLSERMSAGRGGRYGEVAERLNGALSALDRMVAGVRAAIAAVRDESRAVSENSGSLSERASSQAASLQQTSATMEQISNSVKSNADYAASASDLASDASTRAGRGKAVVNEAVGAMQRIESSSTRISDIISVIDGIAFQTNLLALNAAVEAARAGDAGKGFAVVASEVRTLAQRSAEAAKDIKGLIEESASHVGDGVRLVGDAGEVLEAMVSSVQQVSDGIVEISEGGQRQAEGVSEITVAMRQMDEITQANASMAEESAAAAKQLTGQADELSRLLAFFRGADAVVPTADGASDESAQDEAWRAAARPSTPSRVAAPQEQWAEF